MESLWMDTVEMPEFPTLEKDIRTNVLIIGGGIAGVLCAYFLQEAGVNYCLLEADRIGKNITGHTTGKISACQGMIYEKTLGRLGQERAKLFLEANQKAVKKYKDLGWFLNCDMEEKNSYLYTAHDRYKLEKEMNALESLGAEVRYEEKTGLPFPIEGAICFPHQAQFHPLKFLKEISKNLNIYEHSEVREMTEYMALTKGGTVAAEKIIIATHFPFINTRGAYFMKLYQNRSYVIALKNGPDVDGMYLEAENNGISLRNYQDYLLIGGGGHRTGKNGAGWEAPRALARSAFGEAREQYFWANQDCMTLDGRAYIGRYSKSTPDLYTATGFQKWGMTGGMLSAMILSDLIVGRENPYAELFSPQRNAIKPQLFKNMLEAATGITTWKKGKRCSHMGCVLEWNAKEQTWDCPCHGSRFDQSGHRLENPATDDISAKK